MLGILIANRQTKLSHQTRKRNPLLAQLHQRRMRPPTMRAVVNHPVAVDDGLEVFEPVGRPTGLPEPAGVSRTHPFELGRTGAADLQGESGPWVVVIVDLDHRHRRGDRGSVETPTGSPDDAVAQVGHARGLEDANELKLGLPRLEAVE